MEILIKRMDFPEALKMTTLVRLLKSPNTKLVVIKVEVSNECLIKSIKIEGDYFATDPQPIDELMRTELDIDQSSAVKAVSKSLKKAGVYGMSIPEVLNALRDILEEAREKCVKK